MPNVVIGRSTTLLDLPCHCFARVSLLHFIKQLVHHKHGPILHLINPELGIKKNIQAGTRILMMVKGHSSVGCMLFKDSIGRLDLLHDYISWPL